MIPSVILNSIEPFILIIFPKLIIDGIIEKKSFQDLIQIILLMIASTLLIKLLKNIIEFLLMKESNRLHFAINANIGSKVMTLRYQDIEDSKVLDLFNKVKATMNIYGLSIAISSIISSIIVISGLIAIVSRLSILMLLIIIAIVFINVMCEGKAKRNEYAWQTESSPFNRRFSYMIELMFDFKYGKEIRVNNLNDYITSKYNQVVDNYSSKLLKVTMKLLNLNIVRTLVSVLQDFVLYVYLAVRALQGAISIGDFTMYSSAIANLTSSLTSITGSLLEINKQSKFIGDFRSFMDIESAKNTGTKHISEVIPNDTYVFEFEEVSFKYPYSDNYVLKDINIKIKKDEKLSIVGLNGAGKTTFIKLLTRLYSPTKGRILLNGVNIKDIIHSEYLDFFSVVFQDFQLFAFPMYENIVLNHDENKNEIMRVIKETGLEDKTKALPNGYNTEIFKIFSQDGIEFSGGEAQKLAIARALYKNSPFIILDEPTAALDPMAEYEIYCNFHNLVKSKTAIYISHRLASTRLCDQIAVFIDGVIVQYGPHAQLVNEEGIYKEMYAKQAGYYIEA